MVIKVMESRKNFQFGAIACDGGVLPLSILILLQFTFATKQRYLNEGDTFPAKVISLITFSSGDSNYIRLRHHFQCHSNCDSTSFGCIAVKFNNYV